jgi:hypothetical protein
MPALERGLGGSWVNRRTDVFGELVLRLLLEPDVGWPTAEAAAAGWGGDAYTILEDDAGRRVVAMVTVWDTEGDAAEMYNAFVQSVPAHYKGDQVRTIALPSVARWSIPEYQLQALKTDNVVRIIYAPDDLTLNRVEVQLGGSPISPSSPVVPQPPLPAASPSALPADATPATPTLPPAPGTEPNRFSTPVTPAPGEAPVTPAPDGPPDGQPREEPEDQPSGAPGQNLPPAPAQPPGGAAPAVEGPPATDTRPAPTPPAIPTLPRPTPSPSEEPPPEE